MMKENLSKLSIAELEGKLMQAKEEFKTASATLSEAKQKQILKAKTIRGKAAARKRELIAQIMKLNRATKKIHSQIEKIQFGETQEFEAKKAAASQKVRLRAKEFRQNGHYETSLTDMEKIYAWCDDMRVTKEELDYLLELYSVEDLAAMSGDEFYDEVLEIRGEINSRKYETFKPEDRIGGLTDLGIEDLD